MRNEVILDLSIKGVLISFSIVATVTFKVRKMTAIYSQMIGHLFNTITLVLLYWKRMTVSLYDVEVVKQAVSCYQPPLSLSSIEPLLILSYFRNGISFNDPSAVRKFSKWNFHLSQQFRTSHYSAVRGDCQEDLHLLHKTPTPECYWSVTFGLQTLYYTKY